MSKFKETFTTQKRLDCYQGEGLEIEVSEDGTKVRYREYFENGDTSEATEADVVQETDFGDVEQGFYTELGMFFSLNEFNDA